MKKTTTIPKIICALMLTAGLALNISGCQKDSSSTAAGSTVTEADAAELTTDAVSPSNGGMVAQTSSSVNIYKTVALSCGVTKDSTINIASATGTAASYSYTFLTNSLLTCNGQTPSLLAFNFTGSGSFNGPRMSATDKSTGGFVLSGFGVSSSQYLLSTTYNRTGTATSKINKQYTFTSNLAITSTNIVVDKNLQQIVSGTATVTLIATSTSGRSFTFNGTLTFLGNKKATLVLNSGVTYTLQWS